MVDPNLTLAPQPATSRWHWPLMALALLGICGTFGYVLTQELPLLLLLALPVGGLLMVLGLRQPELLTVALLAITWGYVSETLVKFFGMPSAAKSVVVLLVALVLRQRFFTKNGALVTHPLLWWLLGYFLVVCLGLWYAQDPGRTWLVVIDVAKELLLMFVVINTITNERWLERAVWAMLAVGALLGLLALYQELTRTYSTIYGGFARPVLGQIAEGTANRWRSGGPMNEPNAFAQQMLVFIPIGIWAAAFARTTPARIVGGLAAFACTAGAALSFSRGAYLAFLVMLILLAIYVRLNARYLLIIPMVLIAGLSVAPPELQTRFVSLASLLPGGERAVGERDASVERREIEMLMAVYMFADHPIEGVGADNYRALFKRYAIESGSNIDANERNAHSYYLEIAAEHGLLGLIAIGGVIILTITSLNRARKTFAALGNRRMAELAAAMLIGFVGYAITALFLHGDYTRFLWLQVCLAAAFSIVAARAAATAEEPAPQPAQLTPIGSTR